MSSPYPFAVARGRWDVCVDACAEALGRPGGGLGFVYFTDALAADASRIVAGLRESTGVADWIGTVGIGVLATGVELVDEPAVVAMVADLEPGSFRVFSGRSRAPMPDERTESGAIAANVAVVHADPGTPDIEELVADLSARLESGFVVGGLSCSRSKTVQVANAILEGGLSGAVLASDVAVSTRLTQGCSPVGGRHRVTACDGNVIARLDDRPALDVFKEAAGELLARDLKRAAAVVHAGIPVVGSDRGDYKVRNVIGIDPKNGLVAIAEQVAKGAEILFCRRDPQSARADLERMLGEFVAERRADGLGAPRGALYYSCIARGESLFGKRDAELSIVREAIGEVPLVGFFCNGEISHDRVYGYTGVLTLLD